MTLIIVVASMVALWIIGGLILAHILWQDRLAERIAEIERLHTAQKNKRSHEDR